MDDDFVPYPAMVVVDANTLISATLTPGITREMLLSTEDDLYSPVFIRDEITKHRSVIKEKSGLSNSDLDILFDKLFSPITLLSEKSTNRYRIEAEHAMADIDINDTLYVAAALELDAAIWSSDPDLHEQSLIPALTTEAMVARVRQAQRQSDGGGNSEE